MLYGLAGLAGLRIGEVAGLRWRHYDAASEPLGRLVIAHSHDRETTKTGRIRQVPVHPTLAALLAGWKLRGWAELIGRHPLPDDLIIPSAREIGVEAAGIEPASESAPPRATTCVSGGLV